jgi:uncharacterized protein (TIGR02271 family)
MLDKMRKCAMQRTITAMFDRYQDALEAVRRLEAAGVAQSDISIVSNDPAHRSQDDATTAGATTARTDTDDDTETGAGTGASLGSLLGGGAGLLAGLGMLAIPGLGPVVAAGWLASTLVGAGAGAATGGLLGALVGAGVDERDAHTYAEGVRRGGTLVTVRADQSMADRVIDILDDEGTVNLDEREASWRQEGWTGRYTGGSDEVTGSSGRSVAGAVGDTASDTASGVGRAASRAADKVSDAAHAAGSAMGLTGDRASETRAYGAPLSPESLQPSTALGTESTAGYGASERTRSTSERNETIPVVEEQLNVGKREVEGGRVRVRSYVVEQPVQEQVNLRDESVNVERRPVDRPLTGADRDRAFQERTIEAEEKSEEAVVNKEARVKEELVVNKDVNQRTETVSDTVRRTEVDVQDERGNRDPRSSSGITDRNR